MPSTIILSDNGASSGSAGLKQTAGNDGVLILQTTTSGGTATNAIYVDTSQNVGVGVTPSAWGGGFIAVEGNGFGLSSSDAVSLHLSANSYRNSSTWVYKGNNYATRYRQLNGEHNWFNAPSGTAGNTITWTQAMTLDASGNLVLGDTSAPYSAKIARVDNSNSAVQSFFARNTNAGSSASCGYYLNSYGNSWSITMGSSANNSNALVFSVDAVGTPVEKMRIDTSGNLLVGTTSGGKRINIAGSQVDINYKNTDGPYTWSVGPLGTSGSGRFNWYYDTSGNDRMYLTTGGALYNSTGTYGTISDISLKENIVDATPKLVDVMRLRVRNYNMKSDPDKRKVIGVVAQEIEEVFPGLVEETVNRVALEDGTFEENTVKAVKYSVLTTILVKAIQEQQAIIEQLKARLDAANL